MNTAKMVSASSAIAMTAILFAGVANLADGYYLPNAVMAAAAARDAASVTAVAAPAVAAAKNTNTAVIRVGSLDNATIAKWNRLNQADDSRTMVG